MKSPLLVMLDLDGTISDNSTGIVGGTMIGLAAVGVTHVEPSDIRQQIGPPLRSMFASWGLGSADVEAAVSAYRDYYREVGVLENELYSGIPEAIETLSCAGAVLAVATSKPESFAVQILEHFGLSGRFAHIGGATLDGSRESKADIITYTLATLGRSVTDAPVVMVGDRKHDIEGAHAAGVGATVGVTWGFGDRAELTSAGATVVIDRPDQLASAAMSSGG